VLLIRINFKRILIWLRFDTDPDSYPLRIFSDLFPPSLLLAPHYCFSSFISLPSFTLPSPYSYLHAYTPPLFPLLQSFIHPFSFILPSFLPSLSYFFLPLCTPSCDHATYSLLKCLIGFRSVSKPILTDTDT
jgi:hypothetical protein